jgi:acyl carrier protein
MDLDTFVSHFAQVFVATPASEFTSETKFRDLDEWDSLLALSVIAMADEEYGVELSGDDIRQSESVADLFAKIQAKQK